MDTDISLNEQLLYRALEAMRLGNPVRCESVFAAEYPFLNVVDGLTASYKLMTCLIRAIRQRYNDLRQMLGLVQATGREACDLVFAMLRDDFGAANKELEAWSLLYHRYVRVDLDLSLQYLSRLVGQSVRNLDRRQSLGLTRLLADLARRQVRYARQQARHNLRAALPCPSPPQLAGREFLLDWASMRFSENPGFHLLIHGMPGIGKSSFACTLAHRLIDARAFKQLIWLDLGDISDWGEAIAQRLDVPAHRLPVYLQQVRTLVILDDATTLIQNPAVTERLQRWLGAARLIVCAEHRPEHRMEMGYLHLPDLNKSAALTCLSMRNNHFASERQLAAFERFEQLFGQVGGNPKALLSAALNQDRTAYCIAEEYCTPIWESVSPGAKMVWMRASQSRTGQIDPLLQSGAGVRPGQWIQVVNELDRAAILSWIPECQVYQLVPLAKTFACNLPTMPHTAMAPYLTRPTAGVVLQPA